METPLGQFTSPSTLPISDIFATIQGEGPDVGKSCVFLRVHQCPVHCPGCDTSYTWNGSEHGEKLTAMEIWERVGLHLVGKTKTQGLVVSGGEPLLYSRNEVLNEVIRSCMWKWRGLETSGFAGKVNGFDATFFIKQFQTVSLSPKITPCLHGRQTNAVLESNFDIFLRDNMIGKLIIKFVVRDIADIDAIRECTKRHPALTRFPIYLMPYGNDRDEILRTLEWMLPSAAAMGAIVTPRLHSLLWGPRRGV